MFLKLMLSVLVAMTAYSIQPVFAADEGNETLMPKGMWKDPATGLIWDRCSLGQMWSGTTCTGDVIQLDSNAAKQRAAAHNLGGFSDWQLPTVAQLRTLVHCSEGFENKSETLTAAPFIGEFSALNYCLRGSSRPTLEKSIFPNSLEDGYWSATSFQIRDSWVSAGVYSINFKDGAIQTGIVHPSYRHYYARAVRTSQSLGREEFLAFFEQEMKQEAERQKQEVEHQQRIAEQESKRQQQAAEQEAKRQAQIRADEEIRKAADEGALKAVLTHKNPQVMYLAAGKYERQGKPYEARQVYEQLIERFPSSSWAIKANDQLLQNQRVDSVTSSAKNATSEANNRAYKTCRIEMESCYSRNGSNCYRDCNSLR